MGFRYKGVVHERLETGTSTVKKLPKEVVIFQNRMLDDNKSSLRWFRDKDILLVDYARDPSNTRTLFYLAQTFLCLGDKINALKYYTMRTEMLVGYEEEKFYSYYKCGCLSEDLGHDWDVSLAWFMKAFGCRSRVEPLLKIAKYYRKHEKWMASFMFVNMACELGQPDETMLFVDSHQYDYQRWHILGIVSFYAKFYERGKLGCVNAIATGFDIVTDTKNKKCYN
jgi:hypothetical protein